MYCICIFVCIFQLSGEARECRATRKVTWAQLNGCGLLRSRARRLSTYTSLAMVDSMFQVLTHRHTGEASWASSWALPHGMKEVQRAGMGGGRPTPYIACLNYKNRSTIDVWCVMSWFWYFVPLCFKSFLKFYISIYSCSSKVEHRFFSVSCSKGTYCEIAENAKNSISLLIWKTA